MVEATVEAEMEKVMQGRRSKQAGGDGLFSFAQSSLR